jgi:hypothetical protein
VRGRNRLPPRPPPQIVLYDCNGGASQQIWVEEVDSQHDVILHAGNSVIGIHNPLTNTLGGTSPAAAAPVYTLELQGRANPNTIAALNQIFALDGDSIILARSRPCASNGSTLCPPPPLQLVLQTQNARGANWTPLVVGPRNLADNEFWDFTAVDGSGRFPTGGFFSVGTADALWNSICSDPVAVAQNGVVVPPTSACNTFKAGWGSVIVINPQTECVIEGQVDAPCIDLSNYPPLVLPPGVTIRGSRRGTLEGPGLHAAYTKEGSYFGLCANCMIEIRGDYARVTGLRLRGQDRTTNKIELDTEAIQVDYVGLGLGAPPLFSDTTLVEFIATIDHNEMSDWEEAGVSVSTPYTVDTSHQTCSFAGYISPTKSTSYPCGTTVPDALGTLVPIAEDDATLANVRVSRNFMHHNERDSGGYGVELSRGLVEGNTFLMNRHAITAGGEPHNEYRAANNLVLSNAPSYGTTVNQDFDMHGTDNPTHFVGGQGGYYVDIVGNTFLGTNRSTYWLRGWPSYSTDYHRNISREDQGTAVEFRHCWPGCIDWSGFQPPLNIFDNQFKAADPTNNLKVGDFDADGRDDLFLATGTAWFFSPAGAREWRYLNSSTDTIDQLLIGDFDGDGRADVVALHGGQFVVSWGGISAWEVLNTNPTGGQLLLLPSAVTAMTVGDFDGDGRADIFWADGGTWWISYGGNTQFVQVIVASNILVKDLRFGDFNGDGTTDVFGVVNGKWEVRYAPKGIRGFLGGWEPMPSSLTTAVDGLFVADFAGTGRAAVGRVCDGSFPAGSWCIAEGTLPNWRSYPLGLNSLSVAGVGHFGGRVDANRNVIPAAVVLWNGNDLSISAEGIFPASPYSSQEMR